MFNLGGIFYDRALVNANILIFQSIQVTLNTKVLL